MGPLFRIIGVLAAMASRAAFFGPAHELLPAKVRPASFGFVAVLAACMAAAVVRHVAMGEATLAGFLMGYVSLLGMVVVVFARKHAAEILLYMAASLGVDASVILLGAVGLPMVESSIGKWTLAWELLAAAVAIHRLHRARLTAGADA